MNFKKVTLFVLILSFFGLSAFSARLSEGDKVFLKKELEELINKTKQKNGSINMTKFSSEIIQTLENYNVSRKISRAEIQMIKGNLEKIRRTSPAGQEKELKGLFEFAFNNISKASAPQCMKQGARCNHWDCCTGLKCAPVPPKAKMGGKCKRDGNLCNTDNDCCSNECAEGTDGKKRCELTYRCFKPQPLGASCDFNPVCSTGECKNFLYKLGNMGVCANKGAKCKKNNECCSNKCDQQTKSCVDNFLCRDCIETGTLKRGQTCCKDTSIKKGNKCILIPIPVTKNSPSNSFLNKIVSLIIPSANAQQTTGQFMLGGQATQGTTEANSQKFIDGNMRGNHNKSVADLKMEVKHKGMATSGKLEGTNFNTCEINLIGDYVNYLRESVVYYDPSDVTSKRLLGILAKDENGTEKYNCEAEAKVRNESIQGRLQAIEDNDERKWRCNADESDVEYVACTKTSDTQACAVTQQTKDLVSYRDMINTSSSDFDNQSGTKYIWEIEMALLGLEFVALSDQNINDYWSINSRLKEIARERRDQREQFFNQLRGPETTKMRCACLASKSAAKIQVMGQAGFFEDKCLGPGKIIDELVKTENSEAEIYKDLGTYQETVQVGRQTVDVRAKVVSNRKKAIEACGDEFSRYTEDGKTINSIIAEEAGRVSMDVPAYINSVRSQLEGGDAATTTSNSGAGEGETLQALCALKFWAATNAALQEVQFNYNGNTLNKLVDLAEWVDNNESKFTEATFKKHKLFNFSIDAKNSAKIATTAVALAVLIAGIVSIMGGFSGGTSLAQVATIGAISTSVSLGVWLTGSLRGAWMYGAPYVQDEMSGRSENPYKCGSKTQCMEYSRILVQPYNSVCNKNMSASACIKSFLVLDKPYCDEFFEVVTTGQETGQCYLVDPFIPVGLSKSSLIRDSRDYASLVDQGYTKAKTYLTSLKPEQAGDEPIKDSAFPSKEFITASAANKFAPALKGEGTYRLGSTHKNMIVEAAKNYVKEVGYVTNDEDGIEFGEYVFKFHYIWPKLSQTDAIAYPMPGLVSYLDSVSAGFAQLGESNLVNRGGWNDVGDGYDSVISEFTNNTGGGSGINTDGSGNGNGNGDGDGDGDGSGRNIIGDNFGEDSLRSLGFGGGGASFSVGSGNNSGRTSGGGSALDGNSLSGGSFGINGGGACSTCAQNAANAFRRFKLRQDKKNKDFNNSEIGKSEIGKRMKAASSRFRNSFLKPSGKNGNSSSAKGGKLNFIGGSGLLNPIDSGDNKKEKFDGTKDGTGSELAGKGGAGYGAGGYGSGRGSGGSGANFDNGANGGFDPYGADGNGGFNNGVNGGSGSGLGDVVNARNNSEANYNRRNGLSIWEIVTNTYIRVYDRLLEKKGKGSLD